MKKINLLIIFAFAATIGFLSSCDNEILPVPAPVITMISSDTTILPGSDIAISGNIYAAGSIGTITYFVDGVVYGTPITSGFDTDTTTYFEAQFTNVTDEFTFQVQVTDLQSTPKTSNSSTITISLDDLLIRGTDVMVYCAAADVWGNEEFASLTTFDTYTWQDAEGDATITDNIDLHYYNGNYTKANGTPHFISPDITTNTYDINDGLTLTNGKTTYFKILDTTEDDPFVDGWDTLSDNTELTALTGISDKNVGDFDAGTIIAFELEDGRRGVIRAGDAVDGNSNGVYYDPVDYITFDVIVEKHVPVK